MNLQYFTGSALLIAAASVLAIPAFAQTPGSVVGVVGGWVVNEQVWRSEYQTETVGGVQLGGFVNAVTPVPWFRMRAEFMWTQRGGSVSGGLHENLLVGETRTDYLTLSVQPRLSAWLGPLELFAAAGPVLDVVIRNRFGAELAGVMQEVNKVVGAGAGMGIAVHLPSLFHAEVEAQVFEGLGDAYDGYFVSAKNSSFGIVARIGRVFPR